jgi:3'-phosphoadenosine 5'-phosphosulfate sulfotransferase (PAPS reductase)/FAD synthetase
MKLTLPPAVQAEVDRGALFVVNHSGGKDSQAMLILLRRSIPRRQLIVIHAHLEGEEWDGTEEHVRATSLGLPIIVTQAGKTFEDMVRRRRMFPSPSNRQCTSDLKRDPIAKAIRHHLKAHPELGLRVVSCMGLRAQESASRAKAKTWKANTRESAAGRSWFDWLPIHDLSEAQVFAVIEDAQQKPLWVYGAGMRRASCQFCIMACKADLRRAAELAPDRYAARVRLEREIGHTINMEGTPLDQVTGIPVAEPGPARSPRFAALYAAAQQRKVA